MASQLRGINPFEYYLNILSSWPTAAAMASMWMVVIDIRSIRALTSQTNGAFIDRLNRLESADFQNWEISPVLFQRMTNPSLMSNTESLMGCAFVRGVSIPGDGLQLIDNTPSFNGFRTPNILSKRVKTNQLPISFLETNVSFVDLVIRPWLVLTGHYGLVARRPNSEKNVKCPFIDILQFAKTGPRQSPVIRKIMRYYNVVPTKIDTQALLKTDEGLTTRNVNFCYEGQSVFESQSVGFL